jgi:hypothetical protein
MTWTLRSRFWTARHSGDWPQHHDAASALAALLLFAMVQDRVQLIERFG